MVKNLTSQEQLSRIYKIFKDQPTLDRKKIKKILEENSPYSSELIEKLPGVVYCCLDDWPWTMLYLNSNFTRLTGYNYLDVVGNYKYNYEEITYPEDRARIRKSILGNIEEKREYEVSYRITTKTGKIKWVSEIGHWVGKLETHNILEGFIIDMSHQKQIEEELSQKNEFINSIVDNLPVGIVANDMHSGKVLYANDSVKDMLGVKGDNRQLQRYLEDIYRRPEYNKIINGMREKLTREEEGYVIGEILTCFAKMARVFTLILPALHCPSNNA